MQEVKILTQAHQKKENKQSMQPQKKALSFGIHFLCDSLTVHVLLTFRAHHKHSCLYNLCTMRNTLCLILHWHQMPSTIL